MAQIRKLWTADELEALPSNVGSALEARSKHFYTGRPCFRGHVGIRLTANEMCAECNYEITRKYQKRFPVKAWASRIVSRTRTVSRERQLPFDLTRPYVLSIVTETCPALGVELAYGNTAKIISRTATLDRIRPDDGYVQGNVVVISHLANRIKSNGTWSEIERVAAWLKSLSEEPNLGR